METMTVLEDQIIIHFALSMKHISKSFQVREIRTNGVSEETFGAYKSIEKKFVIF